MLVSAIGHFSENTKELRREYDNTKNTSYDNFKFNRIDSVVADVFFSTGTNTKPDLMLRLRNLFEQLFNQNRA